MESSTKETFQRKAIPETCNDDVAGFKIMIRFMPVYNLESMVKVDSLVEAELHARCRCLGIDFFLLAILFSVLECKCYESESTEWKNAKSNFRDNFVRFYFDEITSLDIDFYL
jgi:hypothetical protein